MNLTHIAPDDIIAETEALYLKIASTTPAHTRVLSRQVEALATVLTEALNDALLDIENASDS